MARANGTGPRRGGVGNFTVGNAVESKGSRSAWMNEWMNWWGSREGEGSCVSFTGVIRPLARVWFVRAQMNVELPTVTVSIIPSTAVKLGDEV